MSSLCLTAVVNVKSVIENNTAWQKRWLSVILTHASTLRYVHLGIDEENCRFVAALAHNSENAFLRMCN